MVANLLRRETPNAETASGAGTEINQQSRTSNPKSEDSSLPKTPAKHLAADE